MTFENLAATYAAEIGEMVFSTQFSVVIFLDNALTVVAANPSFYELMNSVDDVSGNPLESFLIPESRKTLMSMDHDGKSTHRLHFISSQAPLLTLNCRIAPAGEYFILFGEMVRQTGNVLIEKMTLLNNELINLTRELSTKNSQLEKARKEIKVLSGLLPICAHCKSIRDESGEWNNMESYIDRHSEAEFSHGICPECAKKYYGEYLQDSD